jgi:hypothetical protein
LTLTNCGKGEKQLTNFRKIKWWLKRHYPGIAGCRVFTDEGGGVVHIVVRQGMKQKRIDKEELDLYLVETLGCGFCDIKRVYNKEGLANYLADQRAKRGMANEMGRQTLMTKYNYFGNWLPPGWLKKFRRAWYRTNGMRLVERLDLFNSWILRYAKDPTTWTPNAPLTWDNEVGWIEMTDEEIKIWNEIENERN